MRKITLLLFVLFLTALWFRPQPSESVGQSFVFPLSLSGKTWTTDIAFGPGFKPKAEKVNDKIVGAILRGEDTEDESVPFLDLLHSDPSGRFFLYFDGRNADGTTSWRVGTNPNGVMTTTAHGVITQDGFFWLTSSYTLPLVGTTAEIFINGRAKFAKDTFNPTKIAGTLNLLSTNPGHGFTVKFKTVGKPLS
jgi:hypothetical protein